MAEEVEIVEIEEESPDTEENNALLIQKYEDIKKRCAEAKIEFTQKAPDEWETRDTLSISIQSGRNKRGIYIYSIATADRILNIEFEKFKFLNGFDAIYSLENKYVEVGLSGTNPNASSLLRGFGGRRGLLDASGGGPLRLVPPDLLVGQPKLEIGPPSTEYITFCGMRGVFTTLKFFDITEGHHDKIIEKIITLSNSLFFQMDMIYGASFMIRRRRARQIIQYRKKINEGKLAYPLEQYNQDAMSLYWYAKTARAMPLLQFLAFYQSVEYYFPRYSQVEARKKIRLILKRPTFRVHRDDDLDQIVSILQASRGGGLGSERAQLRAVVNECLSAEDVRSYFEEVKDRQEHFSAKGARQKFHKIPIQNQTSDLRNDVADRIYDIRCKIVHTKNENGDDEFGMLLPFSEDVDYLQPDIELVEFVARAVLVASSEPIH